MRDKRATKVSDIHMTDDYVPFLLPAHVSFLPEGPEVLPCPPPALVSWYLWKEGFSAHGLAGDTIFL